MTKRDLNKVDVLIAIGTFAFVTFLAFLWAYPYPHPNLWPHLSMLRYRVNLPMLATLGHLGLGFFAALVYLGFRLIWLQNVPETEDLTDRFFFARLGPLIGAIIYSLLPAIWRDAQYLSPMFIFLLCELAGFVLWLWGRGCRSLIAYSLSYFFFGIVSAMNPLALALLLYVLFSDIIGQYGVREIVRQAGDDDKLSLIQFQERLFSTCAVLIGFVLSAIVLIRYTAYDNFSVDVAKNAMNWLTTWMDNFDQSITSPIILTLAGIILTGGAGIAFGMRIRAIGRSSFVMAATATTVLCLAVLLLVGRAWDGEARTSLGLIREFLQQEVEDTKDVKWLFSDGRFDDMLRYEMTKAGSQTAILDVMHVPSEQEAKRLKRLAPEPGDRSLFQAGGADVFNAWARERPDRLEESAWLMGAGALRMFGKTEQQTFGTVLRAKAKPEDAEKFAAADARLLAMLDRVHGRLIHPSLYRRTFGRIDSVLAEKYDALSWRVARQAGFQSDQFVAAGEVEKAQKLREKIQLLHGSNRTLAAQGAALEKMLPTVNLIVTSREGLDIALKRADFALAQRYAREVLIKTPEDPTANFALAMVSLVAKDYFEASRRFEIVLKTKPDEPATLNNLAVCYLRLGHLENAKKMAEHARKVYPNSKPVEATFNEIEAAIKKMEKD